MAEAKPLDGITVVDLTRVLAGPFCTMVLRDLGAEVIKVEPPEGDEARGFGPFLPGPAGAAGERGASSYFTSLNCGKRSVVLDLKRADGRAALAELIRRADVLVENYRPGTLARLGFPPERLRQLNPRLVYAAVSGFGATGPASQRPAYDMIIQALSGLMSITGTEAPAAAADAEPEPEPAAAAEEVPAAAELEPGSAPDGAGPHGQRVRVGTSIADIVSGLYAAIGIAAALARRARTGAGAVLDLGMLDATVSVLENAIARYQVTGAVPGPLGTRHPSITPFETFATADEEIVVAAGQRPPVRDAVLGARPRRPGQRPTFRRQRGPHRPRGGTEAGAGARAGAGVQCCLAAAAGGGRGPGGAGEHRGRPVPRSAARRARHAAAGDGMRRPAGSRHPRSSSPGWRRSGRGRRHPRSASTPSRCWPNWTPAPSGQAHLGGSGPQAQRATAQRSAAATRSPSRAEPSAALTQRYSWCSGRPSSGLTGRVTASRSVRPR